MIPAPFFLEPLRSGKPLFCVFPKNALVGCVPAESLRNVGVFPHRLQECVSVRAGFLRCCVQQTDDRLVVLLELQKLGIFLLQVVSLLQNAVMVQALLGKLRDLLAVYLSDFLVELEIKQLFRVRFRFFLRFLRLFRFACLFFRTFRCFGLFGFFFAGFLFGLVAVIVGNNIAQIYAKLFVHQFVHVSSSCIWLW